MVLKSYFLRNLDVGACIFKENLPIETFNILFEKQQNKRQKDTKITYTDVRKKVMVIEM